MVSNIGTGYQDKFPWQWPYAEPYMEPYTEPYPKPKASPFVTPPPIPAPGTTEFENLRKEVQELKKLLIAAKKFDEATGQPDCEMDSKVELLKKLGKYLGVDLDTVFK